MLIIYLYVVSTKTTTGLSLWKVERGLITLLKNGPDESKTLCSKCLDSCNGHVFIYCVKKVGNHKGTIDESTVQSHRVTCRDWSKGGGKTILEYRVDGSCRIGVRE